MNLLFLQMPIPLHRTNLLLSNSLRVAFQVADMITTYFMKYTERSQIFVLIDVPLCVLGMGVLLYLVDMGDGRIGNEAAFMTAKSLVGIGRGFYQTAAQVSMQAMISLQEVLVVTAVFIHIYERGRCSWYKVRSP